MPHIFKTLIKFLLFEMFSFLKNLSYNRLKKKEIFAFLPEHSLHFLKHDIAFVDFLDHFYADIQSFGGFCNRCVFVFH